MRFETESGSIYVVDETAKTVRVMKKGERLGVAPRNYVWMAPVAVGRRVLIQWPEGTPLLPGSPPDLTPGSLTARVVSCG